MGLFLVGNSSYQASSDGRCGYYISFRSKGEPIIGAHNRYHRKTGLYLCSDVDGSARYIGVAPNQHERENLLRVGFSQSELDGLEASVREILGNRYDYFLKKQLAAEAAEELAEKKRRAAEDERAYAAFRKRGY